MSKEEKKSPSVGEFLGSPEFRKAMSEMRALEFRMSAEILEGRAKNVDATVIVHFKENGQVH